MKIKLDLAIDLFIINASAVFAFVAREFFRNYPKEPPSAFLDKYIFILLLLNILYAFLFWFVGMYDRRNKRALLEEYIVIFGLISTGIAVAMAFFFMGQIWWMSRGILYIFWGISILSLCAFRTVFRRNTPGLPKSDLSIINAMKKWDNRIDLPSRSVSVVIVSYNNKEKLPKCLDSIKSSSSKLLDQIIIVDNNSTDGTAEMVGSRYPDIKLIKVNSNLGYTKAANLGISSVSSEYYLILNPDIIVFPGSIEIMTDHMIKNLKVGIAGCKLLNEDGSLQYSVRRFLDLKIYLYRFTPIRGLMAGSVLEKYYLMQDWDHGDNRLVDWVLGGCMLVRKAAISEVGLMDERFFLYFDDVDWCYRMWQKGWQVAYVAEAAMVHKHMRTSANKIFNRATYEHIKSLFYFIRKHGLRLPANCPSNTE